MARPFGERSSIKKRSVVIDGRKTSVSLENDFWEEVKNVAQSRGQTVVDFVADVRKGYEGHNVSSALRLSVLEHYRGQDKQPPA
ncbi:ribbon-helix-helix domain-containing protein [Tardiphaga sp.]|jgi:predicted DNA-binding ribbon-helix-helix protein|uniref:ribbon-helix-helix domain-containing protein n=1 Tax=Tardiphaga sp. TaxID=1926292 RepID=UPI0037D9C604